MCSILQGSQELLEVQGQNYPGGGHLACWGYGYMPPIWVSTYYNDCTFLRTLAPKSNSHNGGIRQQRNIFWKRGFDGQKWHPFDARSASNATIAGKLNKTVSILTQWLPVRGKFVRSLRHQRSLRSYGSQALQNIVNNVIPTNPASLISYFCSVFQRSFGFCHRHFVNNKVDWNKLPCIYNRWPQSHWASFSM